MKPETEATEEAALFGEAKTSVQEHAPVEEAVVPAAATGAAPTFAPVAGEAEASAQEQAPVEEAAVPEAATGAAPASEPVVGEGGIRSSSVSLSTGAAAAVGEGVDDAVAAEPAKSKEIQAGLMNVKERCAIEVDLQDGADATPLPTPP